MHRWIMGRRTAASIAVVTWVLAACAAQRPSDVVVYASGTDLESANPLVTIHPLSRQIQRHALFVTLTRLDSALSPQPYFARAWTWTGDRRQLTLDLEPTLTWHDGVPTTADDVAFTLAAVHDPQIGSPRAADLRELAGTAVLSPTRIRLDFTVPQRGIPSLLAELPIVPRHILGRVPAVEMRRAAFNRDPVGNGPFRFVDRTPGQRWTFERNERFPAALGGPPLVRRLVVAVVDEPTTKFAGLASGDLDFAGIAPTMAALANKDPMIEVLDYPVLFSTGLVFNTHKPPFDDARVRRAIDLSLDRPRIVAAALSGYGTPATGPVPPENPLALNAMKSVDTGAADSLLDAAGWTRTGRDTRARGGTPLRFELLTVGSGDNAVEQLIQADLAARGIAMDIRQMELAAFLARARASQKTFDALITGIPGDLSLSYVRAMFESAQRGGMLDYAGYHDSRLDSLFHRASVATSESDARAAWIAVQRALDRDTPVAWIYHSRGVQGVSSRMRHVTMDLRGELVTVSRWSVDSVPSRRIAARR